MVNPAELSWATEAGERRAAYVSARGGAAPARAVEADDRLTADAAFRLVSQGTALVWRSDYHNARQLLEALARRIDRRRKALPSEPAAAFHAWRQQQAQRAGLLGLLLVPVVDGSVPLPRAPDVASAIAGAIDVMPPNAVLPLRDLLSFVSAREWRRKGVPIRALGGRAIHPHYGVFPPTRQDYIDLLAQAPLPKTEVAFDLGTGSGVLAAVLVERGVSRVVATDNSPKAIASAREAFAALNIEGRVSVVEGELYPPGRAGLIVCNPPWLPVRAATPLEAAVYDTDGAMLEGFLRGLAGHLLPNGEGWLILSDLAEHLGLRTREELLSAIAVAGLRVVGRLDAPPSPKGARDEGDPLFFARSREVVSLWRLAAAVL